MDLYLRIYCTRRGRQREDILLWLGLRWSLGFEVPEFGFRGLRLRLLEVWGWNVTEKTD